MPSNVAVAEADLDRLIAAADVLLREAVARNLPVLGICLGAQLLAHALGAHVGRNPVKEHGWHQLTLTEAGRADPVLAALEGQEVCQWHGDTFDLPPGGELLATGETCRHQAFRVGRAYGVQFHPEVDPRILDRWLDVYRAELPEGASQRIRLQARTRLPVAMAAAERLFSAWLGVAGWQPRRRRVRAGPIRRRSPCWRPPPASRGAHSWKARSCIGKGPAACCTPGGCPAGRRSPSGGGGPEGAPRWR